MTVTERKVMARVREKLDNAKAEIDAQDGEYLGKRLASGYWNKHKSDKRRQCNIQNHRSFIDPDNRAKLHVKPKNVVGRAG